MASTFSQIVLHVVFSTKGREPSIMLSISERLYAYMGGIIRENGGALFAVGGMPDHVHLLIRWRPSHSVADLMSKLKSQSSHWLHRVMPGMADFAWQKGYSVFSVSPSKVDVVKRYIRGQEEHHRKVDFESELRRLLKGHGIRFDERFLLD